MDPELKLQGRLTGDCPVPVCVVSYADQNDEISLIDLWRTIAARKMLVILSVLVAMVLAYVYVSLAEPLYRAEANVLPPQQQDIQGLMINYLETENLNIERYTPDLVYQSFLRNLKSKGLRREYFDANGLVAHYLGDHLDKEANIDRIFDKKFSGSLKVEINRQDASFVVISLTDWDPVFAANWLNQFIEFANTRTVRQLINNINAAVQSEIKWVRYQLESKLKLAVQRRQDRITNLREALRVANRLGIKSTSSFPVIEAREKAAIEVNTAQSPLYMRGTKALEAEIAVLESRKSDEPFIAGLRDLQEKKAFLESLSISGDNLSAVTVDTTARIPYSYENPGEKLVFILAAIFGLMIGIFLVFVAEFWSKARKPSKLSTGQS